MHLADLTTLGKLRFKPSDWWSITPRELEELGGSLVGEMPRGWVRQGDNFIEICGECGSDARRIDAEMCNLATATKQIRLSDSPDSFLRAAAFYHLRFQRIHPLVEANGRVGRFILAAQLSEPCRMTISEILTGLKDCERDYYRTFESRVSAVRFELFLDLLARITGTVLLPESLDLPSSLDPLYPQKFLPKRQRHRIPPESFLKPR